VERFFSDGFACFALLADGSLWAWGANSWGRLGDGTMTNRPTPARLDGLNGVAEIYVDGPTVFALMSDGTLWAWGDNQYGQLGDGTKTNRLAPVRVEGLNGVMRVYPDTYGSNTFAITGAQS
jgi:alpha-tubulin suppressor-like RCC1 family protein